MRSRWALDPAVTFLNHGSFGACPTDVLAAAQRWRERIEREPVRFFLCELEGLLDEARAVVAGFVGARAADVACVPNATSGVAAVLRSIELAPGDELLTTDHAYNACKNALDDTAARAGAKVVVATVPFPTPGPDAVVDAVIAAATPRTRLALLDHVTSQTALILPVERIVRELAERGIDTLVDAAHAPGMLPMNVADAGAAYTTGNFHKWVCAPKGAAFLHVRRDRQATIRPLAVSHGATSPRTDRSRFLLEFDWTGTADPTPYLCIPEALRFLSSLAPGGLPQVMAEGHAAAIAARRMLCDALAIEPPCPDAMLGTMASVPLPPATEGHEGPIDPLQEALFARFGIEVPIFPWPARHTGSRMLRVSMAPYVDVDDVRTLIAALRELDVAR